MSSPRAPAAVAPPSASRRQLRRLVTLAVAAALAVGLWFAWQTWIAPKPPLPAVDLTNAHADLVTLIRDAEDRVRGNPRSPNAWGRLGMVLLANEYYPEASACLVEAAQRDPGTASWLYLDAQACFKIYPIRAITLLEQAVALDEDDPMFRMLLGELLLEQGRLDDAERHLLRAVESDSLRPWSQMRLAQIALRRGQAPQALQYARLAQPHIDDAKVLHVLLSEIHFRMGEATAAEREQQRSLNLPLRRWPDPHMEAVEQLKVTTLPMLARAGNDIDTLEAIVRAHPESAPARIQLALALMSQQQWPAAAAAAQEALKINPNDAVALNVHGAALRKQGLLDEAVAAYKKSIDVNPQNAVTHYELSNCYYQLQQKPAALDALKTAIRLRPNYANAWRELGQLHANDNDAEAVACLRRAVELAPDDALARKLLDEAQQRLEKARSPRDG
jgi:tetratricopeptide (TPR) repeat protein